MRMYISSFYFSCITEILFAHEFKEGWSLASAKNALVGTKTTKYCERRLCDSCFSKAVRIGITCRKNDCKALFSNDLKIRSLEYDDYLSYLVFNCPLDKPCNQQLTYTDFIKHAHQENKKENSKTARTHASSSRNENLTQSKGKSRQRDNSSCAELLRNNNGSLSNSQAYGVSENPSSNKNGTHLFQQPKGVTGTSLYPGKEMDFIYTQV